MYPIDNATLELLKKEATITAELKVVTTAGERIFYASDLIQGSFSIDRYSCSGDSLELGNVSSGELKFSVRDENASYSETEFGGGDVFVKCGPIDPATGQWHLFPCGVFAIDKVTRKQGVVEFSALDRMVLFEKQFNPKDIYYPIKIADFIRIICTICNVPLADDPLSLMNGDFVLKSLDSLTQEKSVNYRNILSWLCELTGTCAYMDWDGKLRFGWYTENPYTGMKFGPAERFSSNIANEPVTLDGISVIASNNEEILVSSIDKPKQILMGARNPLLEGETMDLIPIVATKVEGLSYTPFDITTFSYPFLYPMDRIKIGVKNADGTEGELSSFITNCTFGLNGSMKIQAKGKTDKEKSYARSNPLTKWESAYMEQSEDESNKQLNNRVQQLAFFGETIMAAMGFYTTVTKDVTGSTKFYFHSNPVLTESKKDDIIYTFNSGGFAVCKTGWNNGSPVWEYGITKEGNAIFNTVNATGINVSNKNTPYHSEITPDTFSVYYGNEKRVNINAEFTELEKLYVQDDFTMGGITIRPYENGLDFFSRGIW